MKSALAALALTLPLARAGAAELRGVRAAHRPSGSHAARPPRRAAADAARRFTTVRRLEMGVHRRASPAPAAARHRAQRGQALPRTQRRRLARRVRERLGQPVEHAHARRLDADHAARRPPGRRPGGAPAGGAGVAAKLGQAFTATQLERPGARARSRGLSQTPVPLRRAWAWARSRRPCSPNGRGGLDDPKQPSSRRWCVRPTPRPNAWRSVPVVLKQQTRCHARASP